MEARSLASLNFLAANPPQYPINPSEDRQEPLVLYISRVPGTRDVILSPFRPQLKNVTSEDVANSFYYVHLDTTAPEVSEQSQSQHDSAQNRSSNEGYPSSPVIPRKPIAGNGVAAHQPSDSTLRAPAAGPSQGYVSPRSSTDYQASVNTNRSSLQAYAPTQYGQYGESGAGSSQLPPQLPPHSPLSPLPSLHDGPPPPAPPVHYFPPPPPMPAVHNAPPSHPAYNAPPSHPAYNAPPAHPAYNAPPVHPVYEAPPYPPPQQKQAVPARKPVVAPSFATQPSATEPPAIAYSKNLPPSPREPFTSNERGYDFNYNSPTSPRSTARDSYREFEDARGEAAPPHPHLRPDDSQRIASQVYQTEYPSQAPSSGRSSPNFFTRSPSPTPTAKQVERFVLKLIRRDPSSGNQWNVGTVSSEQVQDGWRPPASDGASLSAVSSSSVRPSIDIRIETSGYAKFRHMPTRRSLDSRRSMDTSGTHAGAAGMAMLRELTPPTGEEAGFLRQVQMAYSKSWTSNLKDKWNRMEKNHMASRQAHARSQSALSMNSTSFTSPPEPSTSLGQPGPGMKPRGYVFTSPWDGRCDFRTGNAGRSLRCHHSLYDSSSSSTYNPLVADQKQQQLPQSIGPVQLGGSSTVVSELRFNLPSSELLGADDTDKRSRTHQRLGSLGKLLRRDDDGHDDGDISPFDINLGKERAGGGSRGSRVKLGKLIVYPDGLKMLDLIVAANVGVWWGTWERSF